VSGARAASIHARLLNLARSRGDDFNRVVDRYALERWLYRLSVSDARDRLWLKGAMLFTLWFDSPHRPTRDADFLGHGPRDPEALAAMVRQVSAIACDDGVEFGPDSVTVEEIRQGVRYGGLRVKVLGFLGRARCPVQLDVGFGDSVVPGVDEVEFPTLLDDVPAPHLGVYPRATVVAEKLEAIASLGMANSRMKDYFDLHALAREGAIDEVVLGEAIAATFHRRATPLPTGLPTGLTQEFADDAEKKTQWRAFLGKNHLDGPNLEDVVKEIGRLVREPLEHARGGDAST
jgi:predicted nucleotidyltransferase component of viral defense system